ncbi:MAG TPA: hypothetical protein ENI09_01915 [candidate division WWE3 bacterium]|uniref:Uncharacterized protein n=1 Tax=candidate division WWE3 bacterium TaxID=2053526 RepID=A0A7C1NTB7_UNCKA|nr:hypothetical protein [candidate division WWE3 bacterium]
MSMREVFIPKWQRWLFVPLFGGMWILFTYLEFFDPNTKGELGLVGYIFTTALFLGLGVAFWLMTSGKLPAYIIKEKKK